MSLDESFVSNREAVMRGAEDDEARRFADYQEQRILESDAAELAKWRRIFQQADAERPAVHYEDRPAIDRRLFGWREAIADGLEPDEQRDGAA